MVASSPSKVLTGQRPPQSEYYAARYDHTTGQVSRAPCMFRHAAFRGRRTLRGASIDDTDSSRDYLLDHPSFAVSKTDGRDIPWMNHDDTAL